MLVDIFFLSLPAGGLCVVYRRCTHSWLLHGRGGLLGWDEDDGALMFNMLSMQAGNPLTCANHHQSTCEGSLVTDDIFVPLTKARV